MMPATIKRGRHKSSCRLRKIQCADCGCILYGSAAAIRVAGLPQCACGAMFTVPLLRDLEAIDPDGFEQLLAMLDHKSHTQAMRELGYTDAIENAHRHDAHDSPNAPKTIAADSAHMASDTAQPA